MSKKLSNKGYCVTLGLIWDVILVLFLLSNASCPNRMKGLLLIPSIDTRALADAWILSTLWWRIWVRSPYLPKCTMPARSLCMYNNEVGLDFHMKLDGSRERTKLRTLSCLKNFVSSSVREECDSMSCVNADDHGEPCRLSFADNYF